jgi:predicted kinase
MKHRQIIFVVLRTEIDAGWPVVLDSFLTLEGAENKRGEYEQVFADRNIPGFIFEVQTSCWYEL